MILFLCYCLGGQKKENTIDFECILTYINITFWSIVLINSKWNSTFYCFDAKFLKIVSSLNQQEVWIIVNTILMIIVE